METVATTPTLVVYGSIHYDVIAQYERFPQANDRLFPGAITLAPGGMGGNVAAIYARVGGIARFVGSFSNDSDGEELRRDLERDGVDTSWAKQNPGPGSRGLIMVDSCGERAIVGYYGNALSTIERSAGQSPGAVYNPMDMVQSWEQPEISIDPQVFDSQVAGFYCPLNYAPAVLPFVPESLPVFIDAEGAHLDRMNLHDVKESILRSSLVFANHRSFAKLRDLVGTAFLATAKKFHDIAFIETLGKRGCRVHTTQNVAYVPAVPAQAIDSTGAGDSFAAAFLYSYLTGASLREAGAFACNIASQSVRALGSRAGVPSLVSAVNGFSER